MDLSDLLHRRAEPQPLVRGLVANTPTGPDDDLYVTIPAFDGNRVRWGPCSRAPADAAPVRGDHCLVLFDERETPWVVVTALPPQMYYEGLDAPPGAPLGAFWYRNLSPTKLYVLTSDGWKGTNVTAFLVPEEEVSP